MLDGAQIESIFAGHAAALVLFARQWLDRAAAEDVVQDVFVRLMGQRAAPRNVRGWLFRAVRNAAIDQGRSATRRDAREIRLAQQGPNWFQPGFDELIDARAAERALQSLPIDQREVVVMRIWGQMTLAESAAVTGEAVSTVFARYRAALDAVRTIMESSCSTRTQGTHNSVAPSASSSAH